MIRMAKEQSFLDKAKEVIAKNQDVIAVFEELDRTGKFKKRTKAAKQII